MWGFIAFDTSLAMDGGSGTYEFYTVATDGAGNVETPSGTPQLSVTFLSATGVTDWNVF